MCLDNYIYIIIYILYIYCIYLHTVVVAGRCRYSMFRYVSIYPKLNRAAPFASQPAIPTNQVLRCIKWDGHPTVQHQGNPKFEWFTTIDCPITRKYIEMQFWSTTFLFLLGGNTTNTFNLRFPNFLFGTTQNIEHHQTIKTTPPSGPIWPHLHCLLGPGWPRMAPANRFSWEHAERQLPGRCASPSATASRPRGELRSAFCR
jgi:hypothetical protein